LLRPKLVWVCNNIEGLTCKRDRPDMGPRAKGSGLVKGGRHPKGPQVQWDSLN